MVESRNMLSVDLGPVCSAALDELCAKTKLTKSEVVRDLILIGSHFDLVKDFNNLRVSIEELSKGKHTPRTRSKVTENESKVIDTYRGVYGYKGRMYTPAILSALRTVAKTLDYPTIVEIVELSANLPWIASMLTKGERPTLQAILSEKVVAQILPIVEDYRSKEARRNLLRLDGHIKPMALNDLREALDDDTYSSAFDLIQEAKSEEEVSQIRHAALNQQLEAYKERLFGDADEDEESE